VRGGGGPDRWPPCDWPDPRHRLQAASELDRRRFEQRQRIADTRRQARQAVQQAGEPAGERGWGPAAHPSAQLARELMLRACAAAALRALTRPCLPHAAGTPEDDPVAALLQQARAAADLPALAPPDALLMSATSLENTFTCQPQQRNMHGRIFGGFLMRCAGLRGPAGGSARCCTGPAGRRRARAWQQAGRGACWPRAQRPPAASLQARLRAGVRHDLHVRRQPPALCAH
jgi:hypothetical protein